MSGVENFQQINYRGGGGGGGNYSGVESMIILTSAMSNLLCQLSYSLYKRLDSNQHLTMTNQILEKYIALYYIYSTTTNPICASSYFRICAFLSV